MHTFKRLVKFRKIRAPPMPQYATFSSKLNELIKCSDSEVSDAVIDFKMKESTTAD